MSPLPVMAMTMAQAAYWFEFHVFLDRYDAVLHHLLLQLKKWL